MRRHDPSPGPARAPVVHGDRATAERLRRHQLEPARAGQPALVQGWAMTGNPRVDQEFVLVDQIKPVQLVREFAAAQKHTGWGRVFEFLHARAQVASDDVVAVGPREVLSRRGHHVLRLGLQLGRPLAHRGRYLRVAAGDRWPVALHHFVGDAAPQHGPALVHETGEEGVCLVVGDAFLMVYAAVQGDVDAEGQESHAVLRSMQATNCSRPGSRGANPIPEVFTPRRPTSRSEEGMDGILHSHSLADHQLFEPRGWIVFASEQPFRKRCQEHLCRGSDHVAVGHVTTKDLTRRIGHRHMQMRTRGAERS